MTTENENAQQDCLPQEETLLTLLDSVTKENRDGSSQAARRAYHERLVTFQPATYFAKPASISPLVCARFGWTNPSQDLIVCQKCQACVAITYHPLLKAADEERITAIYKEKLCTAHKVTCPFYASAFPTTVLANAPIPSYLASVFPQDFVTLVEQSNPKPLLQKRVHSLLDAARKGDGSVEVSLDAKDMELQEDETTEMFASQLSNTLGYSKETEQWACILALVCWEPKQTRQSNKTVLMLQCPVCLSQRGLPIQGYDKNDNSSSDDSSVDLPPPKRPKTAKQPMNPITGHRLYCPVICGFPCSGSEVPAWKTIANHLFANTGTSDVDDTQGEQVMINIHRLLRSSLG